MREVQTSPQAWPVPELSGLDCLIVCFKKLRNLSEEDALKIFPAVVSGEQNKAKNIEDIGLSQVIRRHQTRLQMNSNVFLYLLGVNKLFAYKLI